MHNVVIIGGGCAGLSAGIYCARSDLDPIIFVGDFTNQGGLLTKTSIVENFPGFIEIEGYDLVDNMQKQAIKYGAKIIGRNITSIDFSKMPFSLMDDKGEVYYTKTVIIATGSTPNKLKLINEDQLWSKGISSCAVCDGALYRNKKIIVVGGGDSACEGAIFLTKFSQVTLVHRRDEFRASKIMVNKVVNNPKINIIYNTVVSKLIGSDKLNSVVLKNVKTGEENTVDVDGLFYGLGLKPNSQLFKDVIYVNEDGYIEKVGTTFETMTSIEGVFVAGDVHDKIYRQAVVACGDGCKAAMDVNNYLNGL